MNCPYKTNPIYRPLYPSNKSDCSTSPQNPNPTTNLVLKINIVAWNCRGLPYAEMLAEHADVLILSEHWLWPFESHNINNIHPCMKGHAVSDKRCAPDCSLFKGCGGIGITWKKHLEAAPILDLKSDWICAVIIEGCKNVKYRSLQSTSSIRSLP